MPELPNGIVTFLFTDVEGSTQLWETYPEAIHPALQRLEKRAQECFTRHGGQIIKPRGEGDSLFVVFRRPTDAVAGACAFQVAQTEANRTAELPLQVRIAIHMGEAELREGDYYGSNVNRCARLRAIAHGGQTVLSESIQQLSRDSLPQQATLRDMGVHQLRDLAHPEHVYQLVHPALRNDFDPLKSLSNLPHNLPEQLTEFVGRETELAEIQKLLGTTRLITLTGVGGCGKTRLALQAVADRMEDFPDGIWFIDLAPLTDPAFIPQAIAGPLRLREENGQILSDTLVEALRSKKMLLLLDNCEHLLADCVPLAARLLRSCPDVKILATSQEALGILGEIHWPVPPLQLPVERGESLAALAMNPAVQLFLIRVAAVNPNLKLTEQNAPFIAAICRLLDGLPLALELAAARTNVLSLDQIRRRLSQRFRLLTEGNRAGVTRHQTLRAAMDWSYDLLAETERLLLRRLSVFSGSWTLEAAEAICSDPETTQTTALPEDEVFDLLAHLIERSLVVCEESSDGVIARYRLLETVRQYATDRLMEAGEREILQQRHKTYFATWGEQMGSLLLGETQAASLNKLEADVANLREALSYDTKEAESASEGLRLANALYPFWAIRGYYAEGRALLTQALERASEEDPAARARAMIGIGALAWFQGDYTHAQQRFESSLEIRRQLGNPLGVADVLNNLGNVAWDQGDDAATRPLFEESLEILRSLGDIQGIAVTLGNLGFLDCVQGDYTRGQERFEECLALEHERKNPAGIANALDGLGEIATHIGNYALARERKGAALQMRLALEDRRGVAESLEGLAAIGIAQLRWEFAACLFGAAEALRAEIGAPLPPRRREVYARQSAACAEALGTAGFETARNRGRALTWRQAVAYGLQQNGPGV